MLRIPAVVRLREGERQDLLAARDGGQEPLPLLLAAAREQGERAEHRRGVVGYRQQAASHLLAEDGRVRDRPALATVLLRDEDAVPAQLRDLAPEVARKAVRLLQRFAHGLERTLALDECARGGPQQLLFAREGEIRHEVGYPAGRLAAMPRNMRSFWISTVPPGWAIKMP